MTKYTVEALIDGQPVQIVETCDPEAAETAFTFSQRLSSAVTMTEEAL